MQGLLLDTQPETRIGPVTADKGTGSDPFAALLETHRFERRAGSIIKLEGEVTGTVYFLLSGWLSVSKSTAEGHRQIVDIQLPGGIVEAVSADDRTSSVEIEALTDVMFAAIPREEWRRLLNAQPEVARTLGHAANAALSRIAGRLLRIGKGTAESIIGFALCELCLRSSAHGLEENKTFHIPMTQQQLGDFCGLSAVHVCRTLRRFKRNGILEVTDHMNITVRDVEALIDIAEIDPDELRAQIVPGN